METITLTSNDFEQGTLTSNGTTTDDKKTTRVRLKDFKTVTYHKQFMKVTATLVSGEHADIELYCYDNNSKQVYGSNWILSPVKFDEIINEYYKFKLVIKHHGSGDKEIKPEDIKSVTVDLFWGWKYVNNIPLPESKSNPLKEYKFPKEPKWVWKSYKQKDSKNDKTRTMFGNGFSPKIEEKHQFPDKAKWPWRYNSFVNGENPYNGFMLVAKKHIPSQKYKYINLLDKVHVYSQPHGLDRDFPVLKMSIPLNNPSDTKYTLNSTFEADLTSTTSEANEELKNKIREIPNQSVILTEAKRNATQLINSGGNGFVTLRREKLENGELGDIKEILITDTRDYTLSTKCWRWNENGLGYSDTGFKDGKDPTFKLAMTMDGSIVADFITAGLLSGDRIRGGTLALGNWEWYKDETETETFTTPGELVVYKDDGSLAARMDKSGAQIWGEIWSYSDGKGGSLDENVEVRSGSTVAMSNGQMNFYLNGEKAGHIAGWSLYEGDDTPSMSISAMDKDNNISSGVVIQAKWIGLQGEDDTEVIGVDMKEHKFKFVTKVEKNGDQLTITDQEITFLGPFLITGSDNT